MSTPTSFQFVTTEDGSPTARIGLPGADLVDCSEAMHSLRGAYSETVYIYGDAITLMHQRGFKNSVLSMGLGLGYVELLAAALALKNNQVPRGESFEIVPELRDYFLRWLKRESVPDDFSKTYDEICRLVATTGPESPDAVRLALAHAVDLGEWKIRRALDGSTDFSEKFGCLCFDAFSSKSTPELWNEDFLKNFFQKTADESCVLSTYACTGALKRALRSEGFEITIREGFSSKRDSTFAVKTAIGTSPATESAPKTTN